MRAADDLPRDREAPSDTHRSSGPQPGTQAGTTDFSQSQARDLAALLALPAMWRGRDPGYIAPNLLDVLTGLLRLDLCYVRLVYERDGAHFEDRRPASALSPREIGIALDAQRPDNDPGALSIPNPLGPGRLRLMRMRPRLEGASAVIVLASRRADFPTDMESFLARMAVDQATVALDQSRLLLDVQQANAAKAAFLATMSHELRTPLNAIIGYGALLAGGIGGDLTGQQQQHVQRIDAAARHLIHLIEGILSFARIEAGKEEVTLSSARAGELTESTAALIEPLARAKGLRLDVVVPETPLVLHTDIAKVRQILLNLLANAVKFTDAGSIAVEVRESEGHVSWTVRDTGMGIPADQLDRVFEPFRQVGQVYSTKASGTGLGLSVSRHLARLLGGDVTAESTMGKGATFVARLPVQLVAADRST